MPVFQSYVPILAISTCIIYASKVKEAPICEKLARELLQNESNSRWGNTDLVGGRVKLLGVERSTETQGNTLTEENVVGDGSDTAVVDLGLGEGQGVDAVLGGDLKADVGAALGVPDGLGTGLDLGVDLVVVRGGEDAQVVGSDDGGGVKGLLVSNT